MDMKDDGGQRFSGKRILIVEDDWFLATDMEQQIVGAGGHVIGPKADLETALPAARDEPIDGALLNAALGAATSFPVADILRERQIPFAFASAYGLEAFPRAYADVPHVGKPFELRVTAKALFG